MFRGEHIESAEEHILERESRRKFESKLPREWISRDITPDYGLDLEVQIVEGKKVTNKVFWVQLKATNADFQTEGNAWEREGGSRTAPTPDSKRAGLEPAPTRQKFQIKYPIPFQIETRYLKHYEGCRLPVFIIYYVKRHDAFTGRFRSKNVHRVIPIDLDDRERSADPLPRPVEILLAQAGQHMIIQIKGLDRFTIDLRDVR